MTQDEAGSNRLEMTVWTHEAEHLSIMAQLGSTGEGFVLCSLMMDAFLLSSSNMSKPETCKLTNTLRTSPGVLLKRTDVSCVLQKKSKEVYKEIQHDYKKLGDSPTFLLFSAEKPYQLLLLLLKSLQLLLQLLQRPYGHRMGKKWCPAEVRWQKTPTPKSFDLKDFLKGVSGPRETYIWFHPSRPPLESCHSLVEPHLVVEPLPGGNQNPWQGQYTHIPLTENQRMSTRNDKLKRKCSTLSELEPTKSSLQDKYPLYSSQGGCQFLNSSKKIFTFWMTWKNSDPKGLRRWDSIKKPNTLDANFCRELGEPANLELSKKHPASGPTKKAPQWDWSTSYLHEWMKFMVQAGEKLLHTSGLIKWNRYTQLHFDLKTLLKRNRSGINLGELSRWNVHFMWITDQFYRESLVVPPPKQNWRIDTKLHLRNI